MTWWTHRFGAGRRTAPRRRRAGPGAGRTSGKRPNQQTLALESLENRNLPSLVAPVNYPVGQGPVGIVAADFNHDNKPDLATVNLSSDTVSVLIDKGRGAFKTARSYAVDSLPESLAAADLTGDGNLDLITANSSGSVSVLLGNGDGTFQAARNFPVGDFNAIPDSVAVGDVNGDGIPDVVVGDGIQDGSVYVLLGNGDGTFRTPIQTALHQPVSSVAVGDVNGDHQLDVLAVVDNPAGADSTVTVLLGNGDGTLRIGASYDTGDVSLDSRALAVADLNGDGKLDFAVPTFSNVLVFLGNGDGTFQAPQVIANGGFYASGITVADVNGDQRPDLVVTEGSCVDVFLGNGDGTFQVPQAFPVASPASEAAVADFNGDGKADLAVANGGDTVSVLLGNGDGTFQTAPTVGFPSDFVTLGVGDLNGDGIPDVIAASPNPFPGQLDVLLGNGDGTFTVAGTYALPFFASSAAIADVNGDGIPDIVVIGPGFHASGNTVDVLLGNGDGTFQAPQSFTVASGPTFVTVADLNGDGHPDLVVASPRSSVGNNGRMISVLLGNGDGSFQPAVNYTVGVGPTAIAVGDLNGDGIPDLVVTYTGFTNTTPGGVDILLGNGDGTFQDATTLASGFVATAVVEGDFHGGGTLDLAVADGSDGFVKVYQGNGDGTFRSARNYAVGPEPVSLALGDLNHDGLTDIVVGGAFGVRILTGRANGTFRVSRTSFGPLANFVAVADLNGDGFADVITDQAVLLNNGRSSPRIGVPGSFAHQIPTPSGSSPVAVFPGLNPAVVHRPFGDTYSKGRETPWYIGRPLSAAGAEDLDGMDGTDLDAALVAGLLG